MNSDPFARTAVGELVSELVQAGQTVATAESLTAGLLAGAIAGVPGASEVLRGGVIVYATDLKHSIGGVDAEVLAAQGPVAAATAEQLALGAKTTCKADWGVGLTGVAGPDTQDGRAVGTVFLGIAGPDGVEAIQLALPGDRWQIRLGAVDSAVSELVHRLRTRRSR